MAQEAHYGVHLLQNYFGLESAIYQVIQGMQQGHTSFDAGLINRARNDVQRKSHNLDRSTYPFAEDFASYLFGNGQPIRVIMVIDGVFQGDAPVETIIPIDLGSNPHLLFQDTHGNTTIDSFVTFEKTRESLEQYRASHTEKLSERGIYDLQVRKSRFFYFRQQDLGDFFGRRLGKNGTIALEEMAALAPLIIPTDYVMLEEVEVPSIDTYLASAPIHVSYRLKQSLAEKLLNRLTKDNNHKGSNVRLIADWVAHRPVVPTMDDVEALESFLRRNPTIGNSRVEYLHTNDYYNEPPKSIGGSPNFKAKNVIVRVRTAGFEPAIREIQIVDSRQYFENELLKGQTSHVEFEKKRSSVPRQVRVLRSSFEDVLTQIFMRENDYIPI